MHNYAVFLRSILFNQNIIMKVGLESEELNVAAANVLGELVCKLNSVSADGDEGAATASGKGGAASGAGGSKQAPTTADGAASGSTSASGAASLEAQLDYLNACFVRFGVKSKRSRETSMARALVFYIKKKKSF
jgi:hypothetical protein